MTGAEIVVTAAGGALAAALAGCSSAAPRGDGAGPGNNRGWVRTGDLSDAGRRTGGRDGPQLRRHATHLDLSGAGVDAAIPAGSASSPSTTTFVITPQAAGTFTWRCTTPCDAWAMAHDGYMRGTVSVAA